MPTFDFFGEKTIPWIPVSQVIYWKGDQRIKNNCIPNTGHVPMEEIPTESLSVHIVSFFWG